MLLVFADNGSGHAVFSTIEQVYRTRPSGCGADSLLAREVEARVGHEGGGFPAPQLNEFSRVVSDDGAPGMNGPRPVIVWRSGVGSNWLRVPPPTLVAIIRSRQPGAAGIAPWGMVMTPSPCGMT